MSFRLLATASLLAALILPSTALADGWSAGVPVSPTGASAPSLAADDAGLTAAWLRGGRVEAARRGAFGTFPSPQVLSGGSASAPAIAANAAGRAAVVWIREGIVEVAVRPSAGQPFGEAEAVSSSGVGEQPRVGVDAAGLVTVAWIRGNVVEAARRDAGGDWDGQQFAEASPGHVALAVAPNGAATMLWSARPNVDWVVRTAARAPGGAAFGAASTIEAAEDVAGNAVEADVAVDAAGNAIAVWPNHLLAQFRAPTVRAARRTANGAFEAPSSISGSEVNDRAEPPHARVAMTAAGDALTVWNRHFDEVAGLEASRRVSGGSFEQAVEVAPSGVMPDDAPAVALDPQARGVAVWASTGGIRAARMTAGFGAAAPLSAADGAKPRVTFDADGNAVAVWQRGGRIESAAYDVVAPRLGAVTIGGETFSAEASDGETPVEIAWDFGDGTSAEGAQVTHRYAQAGDYAVGVTVTDGGGNAVSETRTVRAETASGGDDVIADDFTRCGRCGGPPPPPPPALTPTLSDLRLKPAKLRSGRGGRVTFRLDTAARVVFTIERAKGRRFKKLAGSFTAQGRAGANSVRFKGRLAGRRLRAGRYRLVARVDGATTPVRRAFRVVGR
ncbi:MAG TPA: PKD domain-containing protein [Solirubrobacteraceae bacterium]